MAGVIEEDPLAEHGNYRKGRFLSKGSFGNVWAYEIEATAAEPCGQVAIKFLHRRSLVDPGSETIKKYLEKEILNQRLLCHPHVIQFKELFLTADYICIAMEYADEGDLFQLVKREGRLAEKDSRKFFQQLIFGLDYCHKMGVVNRDIKLDNTLLLFQAVGHRPLLKICDFGYSKSEAQSHPKSLVGTTKYMAPEVIQRNGTYDGKSADIWSCGVMLYTMLYGQYPFNVRTKDGKEDTPNLMRLIVACNWTVPPGVMVSEPCHDLLLRLLVADPAQRLTMAQISVHPWFTEDLPADVRAVNDSFIRNTDYAGVQTIEDIKRLMLVASGEPPNYESLAAAGSTGLSGPYSMSDGQIDDEVDELMRA